MELIRGWVVWRYISDCLIMDCARHSEARDEAINSMCSCFVLMLRHLLRCLAHKHLQD